MSAVRDCLVAHAWHQIGCRCGWLNPIPIEGDPDDADRAYAEHVEDQLIALVSTIEATP